jgi:hypothetical protein
MRAAWFNENVMDQMVPGGGATDCPCLAHCAADPYDAMARNVDLGTNHRLRRDKPLDRDCVCSCGDVVAKQHPSMMPNSAPHTHECGSRTPILICARQVRSYESKGRASSSSGQLGHRHGPSMKITRSIELSMVDSTCNRARWRLSSNTCLGPCYEGCP